MPRVTSLLWLLLGLLAVSDVAAQEVDPNPISTERPGGTNSPLALLPGYWQLEAGYEYGYFNESDQRIHAFPLSLLRHGFADRWEWQLSWPGYVSTRGDVGRAEGLTDGEIALKWQLTEADVPLQLGLYGALRLPWGGDEVSADRYDPRIGLLWGAPELGFYGNVFAAEVAGQTVFTNFTRYAFALGSGSAFLEFASDFPEGRGPGHRLIGGISWLQTHDLVFDVNFGAGLNDRVPDFTVGMGLGYRW